MKNYFTGLWRDRYVLLSLVKSDLKLKYKKSILGVAWSFITPIGLVLIIGTVYSILFNLKPSEFIPGLFAGLNPWIFISSSADSGTGAFIIAEGYLKQTNVNSQIFPIRSVLVNFINLIYSILAFLFIYIFLNPLSFNFNMFAVIPGLIIVLIFVISISNFASIINLNIRDFQPLQALAFQGFFYATPIIFPAKILKDRGFEYLYLLNPFYYMIEIIKAPLLGKMPSSNVYLIAITVSMSLFILSVCFLMKFKNSITFKL